MAQSNEVRRKRYAEDFEYREKQKMNTQKFRTKNPDYNKEYFENNKEYFAEHNRNWKKDNAGRNAANAGRYRARKLNQTPVDANHMWIDMIYEQRPTGYEVDHILSLANGGLHHEDNLQYLTISQNRRKH